MRLSEMIAKLKAVKRAYGDLEMRLQGTRGSDGTCDLDPLKTLIARSHHDPARGLVGDLKDTPDSQPVLVVLNEYADLDFEPPKADIVGKPVDLS